MKSFILSLGLTLICFIALAQPARYGKVYLQNQMSVEGVVDIDFTTDRVVVEKEDVMLSFHASMIDQIITVDECENQRIYQSFNYQSGKFGSVPGKKLFQVVTSGKISLLRRVTEFDAFYADDEYTIDEWYQLSEGSVSQIKNFKKDVLPLMSDFDEQVKEFKKRNNIKSYNDGSAMYLIISYYNRLNDMYSANSSF